MTTANQARSDAAQAGEALVSQCHSVLDGWAEVSKCCLEAADDICQTGIGYVRDQAEQLHEITRDPGAAMREQTYANAINCSLDAADRIAQAYLHSLETVREPLMRVVSAQLPIGRAMAATMEGGMAAVEKGAGKMEKSVRAVARGAERGAEESRHHQTARRRSA